MSCSRHFSSGIFLDSRSFSDAEGARKAARVRICVKIRDIAKRCCLDGCFKSEPNSFVSTSRASRKYLIEHSYTVITFSLTEGWGLQRLINIFRLKKVEIHQYMILISFNLRFDGGGIGPIRSAKYTEKSGLKALSICPNVADKVRNGRV